MDAMEHQEHKEMMLWMEQQVHQEEMEHQEQQEMTGWMEHQGHQEPQEGMVAMEVWEHQV